jgi:hypothetical protein
VTNLLDRTAAVRSFAVYLVRPCLDRDYELPERRKGVTVTLIRKRYVRDCSYS